MHKHNVTNNTTFKHTIGIPGENEIPSLTNLNLFDDFMYFIVASRIILLIIKGKSALPYNNSEQKKSSSKLRIFRSRNSEFSSWRFRRIPWYKGQCRRKCLLSSLAVLHPQVGLVALNICLNLWSFNALNCKRSFVKILTPSIP